MAYHRHHQGRELFLYPDRPGQRGQGNGGAFPQPSGRRRPASLVGGREKRAGGLQLYGQVQYIMGHANIVMTLNYYAHATFHSAQEEMERLQAKAKTTAEVKSEPAAESAEETKAA